MGMPIIWQGSDCFTHMLAVGPTRCGKTATILKPMISKPLDYTAFTRKLDLKRLIKRICQFNMITLIKIHLFSNWIYLRKNIELTGALLEER